jgi:hypothetical protein
MFLLPTPLWHMAQHKEEPHEATQVYGRAQDRGLVVHLDVGLMAKTRIKA